MDRIFFNPPGPFDWNPKDAPLGVERIITFEDMVWASTRNPATAMMMVAALNRDNQIGEDAEKTDGISTPRAIL